MQNTTRPNINSTTALTQATMTAEQYANHAITYVENKLKHLSDDNKTKIICALIQAQSKDFETTVLIDSIWGLCDAIKEHGTMSNNE